MNEKYQVISEQTLSRKQSWESEESKSMKGILIPGGPAFIGTNAAAEFVRDGWDV